MPFFSRDNLEFHYLDRGSGVPFFLQHGLGGEAEKIFTLFEPPPGFRLMGMDCRGHGKTTPLGRVQKLGFDSFADDLVALMDHLQIRCAVMGGTSMGAGVALNCALRYSHRTLGLVLLRPAWLDTPSASNARLFALVAQLIRDEGPERGSQTFRRTDAYSSIKRECPDAANSLMALFSDPRALETVARLERIPQDVPNHDRNEWSRIAAPTLVLANRDDPIHPFEYGRVLAGKIPNAQFQELTPKSNNLARSTSDVRRYLAGFLQARFPTGTSRSNVLC